MRCFRFHGLLRGCPRRGLSLQELLIVISVFLILAIVLTISTNEVMVKTRVSRVRQEMKNAATALNAYRVDNADFPERLSQLLDRTPSYMGAMPLDPFSKENKSPYQYFRFPVNDGGRHISILVSTGPDGVGDFAPFALSSLGAAATSGGSGGDFFNSWEFQARLKSEIRLLSYDPTNGINSVGDIIYVLH
jgi:type II secretory pathway pseudopilin PulG